MTTEANISIQQWLIETSRQLKGKSETPLGDARVLLAHHLKVDSSWLAAHPEKEISEYNRSELAQKVHRLLAGEPLPYILGRWEFFGLEFMVSPAVLIPRPETELLVEFALAWLEDRPYIDTGYDIGTGSGCIAVALASQIPGLKIIAVEKSPAALEIARQNITRHNLSERVTLFQSDLMQSVPSRPIHLVCANLPYIPSNDLDSLLVAKHEPHMALDGGLDGLDHNRELLRQLKPNLTPPYCVLLEIEFRQSESMIKAAGEILPGVSVHMIKDFSGLSRIICIEGTE